MEIKTVLSDDMAVTVDPGAPGLLDMVVTDAEDELRIMLSVKAAVRFRDEIDRVLPPPEVADPGPDASGEQTNGG